MVARTEEADRWYAANIKRNAFGQVERRLCGQGLQVFAPKLVRPSTRYGKRRDVVSLMFPGYVFVKGCDTVRLWSAIRATEGQARLVLGNANQPKEVPCDFMSALLARSSADGRIVAGERLDEGARVNIVSGPFAGVITRIEAVDEQQRIWILLDLLGGARRIEVKPETLVRVAP